MDAIVSRMTDRTIARFVSKNVIADGGTPTDRLAQAFQTLVRNPDDRHRLLNLAHDDAAESPLGQHRGLRGGVEPRRREAADLVLGRVVRLRRVRPRAVRRAHAGGRRRAGERRPARARGRLGRQRRRQRAPVAGSAAAARPAPPRARQRALGRADGARRAQPRGSAARRRLRLRHGAHRRHCRGDHRRQRERAAAARDDCHRHAGGRLDDAAHRDPPAVDRRRAVRAREGDVRVARRGARAAAGRGALGRRARTDPGTADGDSGGVRRRRAAHDRTAEDVAECRRATDRDLPDAAVRRQRRAAGPDRSAERQRLADSARSRAGHSQHRHRKGVPRARRSAGHRHRALARRDHAVDQPAARRARDAAVRLHPAPRRSPAPHVDLPARHRIARRPARPRRHRSAGRRRCRKGEWWAPRRTAALRAASAGALARIGTPEAFTALEAAAAGSRRVRAVARPFLANRRRADGGAS